MPDATPPGSTQLVRIPVGMRELGRWAAGRNRLWARTGLDAGRALHHLLGETFRPGALQPFRLFVPDRQVRGNLYAYTSVSEAALRSDFAACAAPETARVLHMPGLAIRALPDVWRRGGRYGFDVRLRPVVRLAKEVVTPEARWTRGAELDAWFALRLRARGVDLDALPSRDAVYLSWLAKLLVPAATLDRANTRIAQRHHRDIVRGRTTIKGSDIVVHGTFVVRDPGAFAGMLRRGIGRHRAYGYGMVLLRPAGRPPPTQ